MLVLAGIVVIALGFLLRFNPLLVVAVSALVTGLAAGLDPLRILAVFGKAFNDNRFVSVVYIVLPVVGLLERHGLQRRAAALVQRMRGATPGKILIGYMVFRQITAALGLISIAGPAQTVRPLLAPMVEGAADATAADVHDRETLRAMSAATDSIGLFFGEDIFIAMGSILLMKGVLQGYGIAVEPFQLSIWAIPTAIAALLIHGTRLVLLDQRGRRRGA